jgi:hypothetical protein
VGLFRALGDLITGFGLMDEEFDLEDRMTVARYSPHGSFLVDVKPRRGAVLRYYGLSVVSDSELPASMTEMARNVLTDDEDIVWVEPSGEVKRLFKTGKQDAITWPVGIFYALGKFAISSQLDVSSAMTVTEDDDGEFILEIKPTRGRTMTYYAFRESALDEDVTTDPVYSAEIDSRDRGADALLFFDAWPRRT